MEKSLINPNQCQNFGIQICKYPNNPHIKLAIRASEDIFIPMDIQGSTYGLINHPYTKNYIFEYQRILLSNEFIGIHERVYLKFLHWSRGKGQAQFLSAHQPC